MTIRAEYFIGNQKSNEWSGVYGYRPEEELPFSPELFCVTRITTDAESAGLERIAKLLLDEFQESYYADTKTDDQIVRLENALGKMKIRLDLILSREQEILEKGLDLEMSIVLVAGNLMYVGVIGESRVLVYRGGKLVDIAQALVDANLEGFVKTASLVLQTGDRLCLCTSKVLSQGLDSVAKTIENLNIRHLEEMNAMSGTALLVLADEEDTWEKDFVEPEEVLDNVLTDNEGAQVEDPVVIEEGEDTEDSNKELAFTPVSEQVQVEVDADKTSPFAKLTAGFQGVKGRVLPQKNDQGDEGMKDDAKNKEQVTVTNSENLEAIKVHAKDYMDKGKTVWNDKISPKLKSSQKTYIKYLRDFVTYIFRLLKKLFVRIRFELFGDPRDRRDAVLHAARRRRLRILLVLIFVVGVIVIYASIKDAEAKRVETERVESARDQMLQLRNDLDQLTTQVETTKTEEEDKKSLLIDRLASIIAKAEDQKKSGLFSDELDDIIAQGEQNKDAVLLITSVTADNLIIAGDVGRLYPDANLTDLVYTKGSLYASDAGRNVIYRLQTAGVDLTEVVASGIDDPMVLVRNTDGDIVVYDQQSSSAVGKISVESGEFTRFPALSPAVIGTVTEADVYGGNDALYELHQNHQQVFKREKDGAGNYGGGGAVYTTSNPPNWRTDPEFARAIDIAVPYEVYVLIEGQGLKRYLSGGQNSLNQDTYLNLMASDFEALKNATAFDVLGKYLVLGDTKNKRVLLFEIIDNDNKNLMFKRQYVYKGSETTFSNIEELAIDDATGSIYVLDATKIIKLSI